MSFNQTVGFPLYIWVISFSFKCRKFCALSIIHISFIVVKVAEEFFAHSIVIYIWTCTYSRTTLLKPNICNVFHYTISVPMIHTNQPGALGSIVFDGSVFLYTKHKHKFSNIQYSIPSTAAYIVPHFLCYFTVDVKCELQRYFPCSYIFVFVSSGISSIWFDM